VWDERLLAHYPYTVHLLAALRKVDGTLDVCEGVEDLQMQL